MTLEVNFVVESTKQVTAGASAKLLAVVGFKVGGEQKYSREQVHKVTVQLSGAKRLPAPAVKATNEYHMSAINSLLRKAPQSPDIEIPDNDPLIPLNFGNICLKYHTGEGICSISMTDFVDAAIKRCSKVKVSAQPLTIDLSDFFKGHPYRPE